MQIHHRTKDSIEAVRNARILEAQSKHPGMKALSLFILAECAYQGNGLPQDLGVALEYAQRAANQNDHHEAREHGFFLRQKFRTELGLVQEKEEFVGRLADEQEKKQMEETRRASEEKRLIEEDRRALENGAVKSKVSIRTGKETDGRRTKGSGK